MRNPGRLARFALTLTVFLIMIFHLEPVTLSADELEINEPIGIYVLGEKDDTLVTALCDLTCFYMKLRGYDPVILNDAWRDRAQLHSVRKLRKRAVDDGVGTLVLLRSHKVDHDAEFEFYRIDGSAPEGITARNVFKMHLSAVVHSKAESKWPDVSREFKGAIELANTFVTTAGYSWMFTSKSSMRLVSLAIDSVLSVFPERPDTSRELFTAIPANVVCDREYAERLGMDVFATELARQMYMANCIMSDQLGITLHVQTTMMYDLPHDIRSLFDLSNHLSTEEFDLPDGLLIFFSGANLEKSSRYKHTLGVLGLSALLGRRVVIAGAPVDTTREMAEWDYLFEGMIIAHEVGHALGAIHTDDKRSLMYPVMSIASPCFDSMNTARIHQFLPLHLGQECFINSLDYRKMIDSLAVLFPDTMDLIGVARSIIYDHRYAAGFIERDSTVKSDFFYDASSALQLLMIGIEDAARAKAAESIEAGIAPARWLALAGYLFLEADSVETGCAYLDRAREAGLKLPIPSDCLRPD